MVEKHMAVVKTKPIKTNIRGSLDYIGNPDKTDGKLLISSYGCSYETADLQFALELDNQTMRKGDTIARHMIQSFSPEDKLTPEQAHEIGKKWADKILGGKYQYVISTHIDKQHIHNHIIFNAVSFADHKKYVSNKYTYRKMREYSDELCREYGLSVIDNPKKNVRYKNTNKGKKYYSHKDRLCADMDSVIQVVDTFEDFLNEMCRMGYEIKTEKLAFCHKEWKKYVRVSSLGGDYSVAAIKERLITKRPAIPKRLIKNGRNIELIINISENIKCLTSPAYAHWAALHNLKEMSKTLNYLIEHDITSFEELDAKINDLHDKKNADLQKLKQLHADIKDNKEKMTVLEGYESTKPIAAEYDKAIFKSRFRQRHFDELHRFEAMQNRLKELYPSKKIPTISALKNHQKSLISDKDRTYKEYKALDSEIVTYEAMRKNIDTFLGHEHNRKHDRNVQKKRGYDINLD
ncbi:MAG: relaxase/mobilization nuclease domain-containing protein [Candidatus Ornithomonoglobus sp.]